MQFVAPTFPLWSVTPILLPEYFTLFLWALEKLSLDFHPNLTRTDAWFWCQHNLQHVKLKMLDIHNKNFPTCCSAIIRQYIKNEFKNSVAWIIGPSCSWAVGTSLFRARRTFSMFTLSCLPSSSVALSYFVFSCFHVHVVPHHLRMGGEWNKHFNAQHGNCTVDKK